ncbi:MAG: glycoside hydrolase family 16 protein [Acidimicrobiales bacterium]
MTTFTGTSMPANWFLYKGQPGGDPGTDFDPAHVTVSGGLLRINTYQDANYANAWVTGGTSYSGTPGQTYGAYFVRSRITGPGDDNDELLWPDGSEWPPEVDFNETYTTSTGTNATVHFNAANNQDARSVTIDMTQWHTWGVIWTPTSITYTVDGNVWGSVTKTAEIPTVPMHLSIQSQTFCSANWACPTANNSLLVDWVAIYKPS